mmetsp:Transcript_21486/g.39316  ORF Transcript_21486/g.39316 Transcript_21486/m.39316 type:complete len:278 (+) Transcript_21486:953-1786(+)
MPRHLKVLRKSWEKLKSAEAQFYDTLNLCKKQLPNVNISPSGPPRSSLRRRHRSYNILNNLNEPRKVNKEVDFRKDIREKLSKYNDVQKPLKADQSFTYFSEKVKDRSTRTAEVNRRYKVRTVAGFQVPCKKVPPNYFDHPRLKKRAKEKRESTPLRLVSKSMLADEFIVDPETERMLKDYRDLASQNSSMMLTTSDFLRQSFDESELGDSPVHSRLEQMIKLQGYHKKFKFGREQSTSTLSVIQVKSGKHGLLRKAPSKIIRGLNDSGTEASGIVR